MEMPTKVSVRRPDRMRIESRNQAAAVTIVGDGDHTWIYMTPAKKYIKREASGVPEPGFGDPGILSKDLPDVTKSIQSVKVTGEETIAVSGHAYPCWIVETKYGQIVLPRQETFVLEAVQTNWISKAEGLSLQNTFNAKLTMLSIAEPVAMTQTTRTTALRLNPDLPDSAFVFRPPAGAKETEDWTLPGIDKPDALDKAAPDFRGKTLEGGELDLAALRGKVVLLEFCTTWSQPCKRDLPGIEELHRDYAESGLSVIGVSVGEEAAAAKKFWGAPDSGAKGEAPPVVLVEDTSELVKKLSVYTFPTLVIIDREGKVAAYEVGVRGESAVRADLAKLGIGGLK
jgi:cytochrome c biogenesis protein CcmG/thiol:disulfide interchange protein DsbE